MRFPRFRIKQEFVIHKLITCYYFELAKNYAFAGESHDFWEFLYVDKGEFIVETGRESRLLRQGELLFLEPDLFHATRANGTIAPNIFIVSFECRSPRMQFFKEHFWYRLEERERELLAVLMEEGENAFGPDYSVPPRKRLVRKQDAPVGGEQLFVLTLEMLLIRLVRLETETKVKAKLPTSTGDKSDSDIADLIIAYLEANLNQDITLEQICHSFGIGKTQLSILFKKKTGCSVIEYISQLKIAKAKAYIREDVYNLTEIAELLGYNSLHYFSKHFKKITGASPSEYSKILNKNLFKRV
ncbi:helix-turn-helix transcriptional regulator [Paenibacillus ginsengarvi]|uniref:AraC family transcriptional regulator n=1 Tax=Paenibacillus ginsengarvi TaxID=400777 RepID=A0A3B0CHU1_9BACL|nr:AraC family transcriptional regulator [Paenibacillus ginsengarvi]RKN84298.1 AraC family transcriptional regulator [Paenibacillus ginsengarvi]